MLYPINEIFYSIQGEGFHAGRPAVFIRLAGCNLKCKWCDTDHSKKNRMTEGQITDNVFQLWPTKELIQKKEVFVVLTGGEPTIHNLEPLLIMLQQADAYNGKVYIALETNGTDKEELRRLRGLVEWITISPKEGFTKPSAHRFANELKIVLDGIINPDDYSMHFEGFKYIQPCSENYQPAVDFVLNNTDWKLSIQTQKVIGIK